MILGVDISIFLYKYLHTNDDHIEGITRLLMRLVKNGILPFIIFDGRPPKEKSDVLISRKEKREYLVTKKEIITKLMDKMEGKSEEEVKKELEEIQKDKGENMKLEDEDIKELMSKNTEELKEEFEKTIKRIVYVKSEHIESTKRLCDYMGIPYIVSKGEAESLLAHLCKEEIIDGCISEDTDILANGGKIFLRNVSAEKNSVDEYCLEGILTGLEMTYEEFMDMCILCGCDYTSKIGGMGPMNAYKMIKKHGNIESTLEELKKNPKFVIPSEENFNYVKARDLFVNSSRSDNRDEIIERLKMKTPNMEEFKNIVLTTKLGMKHRDEIEKNYIDYLRVMKKLLPENTREMILPEGGGPDIKKKKIDTSQTNKITSFFTKL
jgi:flap endonuclease-1